MRIVRKLGKYILRMWRGYLLAIGLVALATWLKELAQPVIPPNSSIIYILVILPTAIFFGFGPSILVCVLAVLAVDFFFFSPLYQLKFNVQNMAMLPIFLIIGILVSYLASNLRRKNEELVKEIDVRKTVELELIDYRDNLEDIVKQRTNELEETNLALQGEINERKKVEDALRESEQRFREMFEKHLAVMLLIEPDSGKIVDANTAAAEYYGYSREVLGTMNMNEINPLPPDEIAVIRRMVLQKRGNIFIFPNRLASGEVRTVEVHSSPIKIGPQILLFSIVHDVTERKKMEEELQLERDKLISIMNSMEDGICIMSSDFEIEYINPSLQSIFGDVIGRKCYQYFNGLDDVCSWCNNKGVFSGTAIRREVELSRTGKVYEVSDAPLRNADGSISRLAMYHDITERKRVEQLKDEFIGMVSHELKTPLTVVIGALSVARTEGLSAQEQSEMIVSAAYGAEDLAAIIENLLELSRYQSKRLNLQTEKAQITDIVGSVIVKLYSRSTNHHFVTEIPDDIPSIMVDRLRIERVLYNLIENGIKYSPNGGEIKVFVSQGDSQLVIGVSDQGIGISPENQAKLFQSFERIGAYGEHSIPGLGLGLRVCRLLVEAHKGRIWVESEPGKGSTFFFTIPIINEYVSAEKI